MRGSSGPGTNFAAVECSACGSASLAGAAELGSHGELYWLRDLQRTIAFVKPRARGPGLKKTHALPLLSTRKVELWQSSDYRWRELFESADVMSEGATRDEPDGKMYYGSTSILLPFSSRGGLVPDDQAEQVARLLGRDPHARLRATRIARLEAQVRSAAPIGRVRAELGVKVVVHGIQVGVEVEARVHRELGDRDQTPRKAGTVRTRRGAHAS